MVGLGGLEPPTSPLSGARSSHLSYRPLELEWRWKQPEQFTTAALNPQLRRDSDVFTR
jgi:hypothetical protein